MARRLVIFERWLSLLSAVDSFNHFLHCVPVSRLMPNISHKHYVNVLCIQPLGDEDFFLVLCGWLPDP